MFSDELGAFAARLSGRHDEVFEETFRCFPVSFAGKEDKEKGDKIILPASAFETLANMTVTYPMQFEIRNDSVSPPRHTHVGVLEFTAKEGQCFMPYWIMQNLLLAEGSHVVVKNVTLPLATYVKFRPQTVDFLDISDPKAVLESTLRNFSCMTKDDQICLPYNGKNYFLDVVDVEPQDAASIIEADVKVDFEAPVGYVDPATKAKDEAAAAAVAAAQASSSSTTAKEPVGNTLGGSGSVGGDKSLAELARLRAERARQKQLEEQQASYIPFSGGGLRVDGKSKDSKRSSKSSSGGAAPAQDVAAAPAVPQVRKSKWKTKTKAAAFHGAGRSLNDS